MHVCIYTYAVLVENLQEQVISTCHQKKMIYQWSGWLILELDEEKKSRGMETNLICDTEIEITQN